jgi:hypothetical protein
MQIVTLEVRRRRLPLVVGSLVLLGMAAAFTPTAPAGAKKSDTKKADPAKKNDPVAKESKVVDVMVGTIGGHEQVAFINESLEKAWKENRVVPSERCSDYEFIRRASLDIIGRIAKIEEIDRFLKDKEERRRSLLIERLLAGEEFANNWANLWTVLLMTRSGTPKLYREQMHEWLADMLMEKRASGAGKTVTAYPDWSKIATELLTAQGETNENGAVNFVLTHLGDEIKQDAATNGKYDMVPVTSRTTRLFLGLRTQCVQCHDHPFNGDWGQHHFWGINAFFRQVDPNGRPGMMVNKNKKELGMQRFAVKDNPNFNVKGIVPYERRSGVLLYTDATFLDGKKMGAIKDPAKQTRRTELAKFITSSPYFAKAYVNRTWGHFFGRSFTKDYVDDFGEHNPIAHQELFEKISEDWAKKYHHNPKDMIRWICNSKAYGLSSIANKSNDKSEDEAFFARMLLKAMTPEQLFDSLMTATAAKVGQTKESKAKLRDNWLEKLIVNFGDDEGNEGSFNGTVVQALMLMNGQDINTAIMDKDTGTASVVMKMYPPSNAATAGKAMDILFKAALNRPPTRMEMEKILSPSTFNFSKMPTNRDPVAFWTGYYQDVFWALLNSNEFILNH